MILKRSQIVMGALCAVLALALHHPARSQAGCGVTKKGDVLCGRNAPPAAATTGGEGTPFGDQSDAYVGMPQGMIIIPYAPSQPPVNVGTLTPVPPPTGPSGPPTVPIVMPVTTPSTPPVCQTAPTSPPSTSPPPAAGPPGKCGNKTIPGDVIAAAQASEQKYGVPASVSIAQWGLESGYGSHMPAGSNNPFGIKAVGGQSCVGAGTQEVYGGKTVNTSACFRKFDSLNDAFDSHGKLLANGKAYSAARAVGCGNASGYANALQGHYATDPNYGAKLNKIISCGNLTQYDKCK